MERTEDFDLALSWASEFGLEGRVIKVWIPKNGFLYALRNSDGSVSFTREDSPTFGIGIGKNLIIDPRWKRFALPKYLPKELTLKFELVNRWRAYQIETSNFKEKFGAKIISDQGIEEFLNVNSPNASTYPGNDEVQFWVGIFEEGELKAVGCVAKWESGEMVISSIATKISERRKGYGSRITKAIVAFSKDAGISTVTLAVNGKNSEAARVYESVGFTLLGEFNTFEI